MGLHESVAQTYTFLPWTPVEIIHSRDANKDWVRRPRKPRVWKIPALKEFIWFHLHLLSPLAVSILFKWSFFFSPNIKMPKNKYAVSSTSIIDNFWSVITSIGPIAENILHFVLEDMVLSHMRGKSSQGEILVQLAGPERQRSESGQVRWQRKCKVARMARKACPLVLVIWFQTLIGGMTASTFAHFTCQLHFFGLTSQTWLIYN